MSPGSRLGMLTLILCALLATAGSSHAAPLKLPAIFSDHMVLQFGRVIPVWGWAEPGESVKVTFRHFAEETTATADGSWRVEIGPLDAGGPDRLYVVSGEKTIVLDDVLCGEVWLCSGQSNMAMTVDRCLDAENEIAGANFPQIRQFKMPSVASSTPCDTISHSNREYQRIWQRASPETVGLFTAAGYFFARDIHQRLGGVPVGLINSSWGGSVAEAWVSEPVLETDPELAPILKEWAEYSRHWEGWRKSYKAYLERAAKAGSEGETIAPYYRQPSVLFNGMINPLVGYGMRGALWYQGEANIFRAAQYAPLFQTLIRDWREQWGDEFPFIWAQLPGLETIRPSWPLLREAQAKALDLPNTAMAVTIDVGEQHDIHPRNKQAVGHRMALAARGLVYLEDIPYMAPLFSGMTVDGSRCRIEFSNAGEGLTTIDGAMPAGFELAGADSVFHPAGAEIDGGEVIVWSDKVAEPVAVRFLWDDYPESINLYSTFDEKTWLPAAPFRTDDWDAMPEIELVD